MNYDKWNSVDAHCSEKEATLHATGEHEPSQLKMAADVVFHRAEEQSSTLDGNKEPYHQCIQMYSRIIDAADTGYTASTDTLGCMLNIACCFIRIGQWQRAETSCRKALKHVEKHDWKVKLRAEYFITYSLLKQSTETADSAQIQQLLQHASSEAMVLNDLIVLHKQHIAVKEMQEYMTLMKQLQEAENIASDSAQQRGRQHFETAVRAQAEGLSVQAAEGLLRCVTELQASSVDDCDDAMVDVMARMLIQAGVIYLQQRMYVQAVPCFEKAVQEYCKQSLLCGMAHYYIGTCMRHTAAVVSTGEITDQTESHLVKAVNVLEMCVFQLYDNVISDTESIHFAVHLLSKQVHLITNAALLSDTTTVQVAHSSCILALYQHLFRAYDALADHLAKCKEYDLCNQVTDRTIDACSALIAQVTINNSKQSASNNGTTQGADSEIVNMLLTRRPQCFVAKAMLYKDHTIHSARISGATPYTGRVFTWSVAALPNAEHTKHTNNANVLQVNRYSNVHRMEFDNAPEAVAVFLQVAGEEYEPLNLAQCMRTFHILATYTMEQAAIEPFQIDTSTASGAQPGVNKKDLAEKAAEAFKKVSILASLKISAIDKSIAGPLPTKSTVPFASVTGGAASDDSVSAVNADATSAEDKRLLMLYNDKYFHLQQSMLALYNAGVCAFHCDNTLAQRHLESAECVRKDIDILLATKLQKQYDFDALLSTTTVSTTATGIDTDSAVEIELQVTDEDQTASKEINDGTTMSPAALQDRSLHGYYAACGDLAFHLSNAYLRMSNYTEALQEACAAVHFYEHSERLLFALNCLSPDSSSTSTSTKMSKQHRALLQKGVSELVIPLREMTPAGRLRQRQTHGLVALCYSACGEDKKAEQALRNVADLCLGPIEDAERETRAVRRTISHHQSTVLDQLRADRDNTSSSTSTSTTNNNVNSGTSSAAAKPAAVVPAPGQPHNLRVERIDATPETRKVDFNLLIAYSILVAASAIIVSRFVSF